MSSSCKRLFVVHYCTHQLMARFESDVDSKAASFKRIWTVGVFKGCNTNRKTVGLRLFCTIGCLVLSWAYSLSLLLTSGGVFGIFRACQTLQNAERVAFGKQHFPIGSICAHGIEPEMGASWFATRLDNHLKSVTLVRIHFLGLTLAQPHSNRVVHALCIRHLWVAARAYAPSILGHLAMISH
jgi:hypothetical protein